MVSKTRSVNAYVYTNLKVVYKSDVPTLYLEIGLA